MTSSALVSHLVNRIKADIDFLNSQSLLSKHDRDEIIARLPSSTTTGTSTTTTTGLEQHVQGLDIASGTGSASGSQNQVTARALWDYQATQPDDLAFAKGDTITIVEELSPDWWKGSLHGRIGLFPSNYVEKITTPAPGPIRAVPPIPQQNSGYGTQNQQQYPAPQDSWNGPGGNYGPLQNNYNASYNAPPPNQYGGQQQPYQPYQPYQPQQSQYAPSIAPSSSEKQDPAPVAAPVPPPIPPKKKLPGGALGKMMATSFAGGIGFGTGTALASEAVHAIF